MPGKGLINKQTALAEVIPKRRPVRTPQVVNPHHSVKRKARQGPVLLLKVELPEVHARRKVRGGNVHIHCRDVEPTEL